MCPLLPQPGQHSNEGPEYKTTGGVHVQRAQEAGLRRGLPLALPVHRLRPPVPKAAATTTIIIKERRGAKPDHSRCPPLPPVPSNPAPCLVIQVCLHSLRNQYNLIPIDLYGSNIWFSTRRIHTWLRVRAHTHTQTQTYTHLSFSSPLSCYLLSVTIHHYCKSVYDSIGI